MAELIKLSPDSQLDFRRPFSSTVKQVLHVTNVSPDPVAFKVKTTAPKQYCVRPNAGRMRPGDTMTVEVLLQPMKDDPPADFKCKDKFLVQGVKISPDLLEGDDKGLAEAWAAAEAKKKAEPSIIAEKKLRVVFVGDPAPRSLPVNAASPAGPVDHAEAPPPYPSVVGASGEAPTTPAADPAPALSSLPREDVERQLSEARDSLRKLQSANETLKKDLAASKRKPAVAGTLQKAKGEEFSLSLKMVALVAVLAFLVGLWFRG